MTDDTVTIHRVSAGPYTLGLPANGVAILYEDGKQLPGGIGYLDALVQFAGEVIRLRSMIEAMRVTKPLRVSEEWFGDRTKPNWPDPTPEQLADPLFDAIWQRIKTWDINVPGVYEGYCGATGNHVRAILDAIRRGER